MLLGALATFKLEAGCADCGFNSRPEALDFDHVRGEKKNNLHRIANNGAIIQMLDEIEKCEVVCANCHRIRTSNRRAGLRVS